MSEIYMALSWCAYLLDFSFVLPHFKPLIDILEVSSVLMVSLLIAAGSFCSAHCSLLFCS